MEPLNAKFDLSTNYLFEATNSASTPTLNISGNDNGKKKGISLTKKNTSQFSVSGTKKRLGFLKKKSTTSISVHRSEEVMPDQVQHMMKQHSSVSSYGEGSFSGKSSVE